MSLDTKGGISMHWEYIVFKASNVIHSFSEPEPGAQA